MKPFSKWTIEAVEEQFNLTCSQEHPGMTEWLTLPPAPEADKQRLSLPALQQKLLNHVYDWNEQELIVYFIAPLLHLVDFEQEHYHPFFQREISVKYHNEILSGVVDCVIAQGKRSPKRPFFFLQEYKKEHDSSNDPLGQLMIAMVAAQQLNQQQHPVYGAYVIGRYWHFVLLDGLEYAVHTGFNASKEEIQAIFGVLKNTKAIIDKILQETKT